MRVSIFTKFILLCGYLAVSTRWPFSLPKMSSSVTKVKDGEGDKIKLPLPKTNELQKYNITLDKTIENQMSEYKNKMLSELGDIVSNLSIEEWEKGAYDKYDLSKLMVATICQNNEIVKSCIQSNNITEINCKDLWGRTALMYAAMFNNTQAAEMLLTCNGIDINAKETIGDLTAAFIASANGCSQILQSLIIKGAKVEDSHLLWSARNGDMEVVKLLLKHPKINIKARDEDGINAFMYAASSNSTEMLELLSTNFNFNERDKQGNTATIFAAKTNAAGTLKLLLDNRRVDVNARNNARENALWIAHENNYMEAFEILANHPRTDVNALIFSTTLLTRLVFLGELNKIKILLQNPKIDVNVDIDGVTALMAANDAGKNAIPETHQVPPIEVYAEIVEALLNHKDIKPNKYIRKNTALHIAISCNDTKIIKKFIACDKVDVNAQTVDDDTVLMWAVSAENNDIVQDLLARQDIKPNIKNIDKDTALHFAIDQNNVEMVKKFIACDKVDVNAQSANGNTVLMWAATYGHYNIVNALLERKGVEVDARMNNGATALMCAARAGDILPEAKRPEPAIFINIVEELLKAGANINATAKNGDTPFMHSVDSGSKTMGEKFIKKEANVYAKVHSGTFSGYTALTYAAFDNKFDAAETILTKIKTALDASKKGTTAKSKKAQKVYDDFINSKSFFGKTALMVAAEKNHKEIVKLLLNYNADLAIKRWLFGQDALGFAKKNGYLDVVKTITDKILSTKVVASCFEIESNNYDTDLESSDHDENSNAPKLDLTDDLP